MSPLSRLFLRLFLPAALLVVIGIGFHGNSELNREMVRLRGQETLNVGLGAGALSGNLESISRDLAFLSSHSALQDAVRASDSPHLPHLAEDFANFSRSKRIYGQLRWIDETGMERVRVDYVAGQPRVAPHNALQNKGSRYYFSDTLKLNPGEVFVSPLDLNIEHDRIEVPYKPMLRVATPIVDGKGNKRGIVILNYFGRAMLDAFATATTNIADHIMVLNREGYWLKSPNADEEWGFMFKRPELTLGARAPAAWKRIQAEDAGQMAMDDGLWTWKTVYPLLVGQISSTGTAEAFMPSRGDMEARLYSWKVVAHLPADTLSAARQAETIKLSVMAALLLGLIGFGSWRLAQSWTAQAESVAQLKAVNTQLTQMQNQLLQSEKLASIGLLAAGVAHEINNPIGFVNSNLSTLKHYVDDLLAVIDAYEAAAGEDADASGCFTAVNALKAEVELDYLKEQAVALLAESHEGLDRVKKIIQSLKDFSRIEMTETWRKDDLRQGIESTLSVVWNELKYKCDVRKEYGDIPPVECVLSHLNQVFMNLLVNAAHAIEGHGVVTIRTGCKGDEVWVEITDTGKGIAPENLSRIFDPFFTTKPVGKGTGLGLSVSHGIVEKHHGRIEVESEVGKGSTFRVCLPIRQPAASV